MTKAIIIAAVGSIIGIYILNRLTKTTNTAASAGFGAWGAEPLQF
jgi:hypothetical protein